MAVAAAAAAAAAGEAPAAAAAAPPVAAEAYLSEDFFPGLALLEPQPSAAAAAEGGGEVPWRLLVYRGGQRPAATAAATAAPAAGSVQPPPPSGGGPLELEAASWGSIREAAEAIGRALRIAPLEPLQTPWGLFDAQGRRLESVAALRRAPVAFFQEIGVWMWPAVREGFEQQVEGVGGGIAVLRTLSLRPKVFEVRDFLTKGETQEVMRLGEQQGLVASKGMMQSKDRDKGTAHAQFRTSKQAWLSNGLSPLVRELDGRVSDLTRVPASHNEPVQLLRYGEGQYYHGHMDWTELELYADQRDIWVHSHFGHQDRLATVFWYLNDVEQGGETIFPKYGQRVCEPLSQGGPGTRYCAGSEDPDMASCEKGLKVPPRQGTVILWYNYHPSGRGDRNSLHAGCPVGPNLTKWSANKWVQIKPNGARAEWIDDHPALKRHGWAGGAGGGAGAPAADPDACQAHFHNEAAVPVDLLWLPSPGGGPRRLASIPPGGRSSQDSYRGHAFVAQEASGDGGGSSRKRSNEVSCRPPSDDYVLTADFRLESRRSRRRRRDEGGPAEL